jgi:hypothetical protein
MLIFLRLGPTFEIMPLRVNRSLQSKAMQIGDGAKMLSGQSLSKICETKVYIALLKMQRKLQHVLALGQDSLTKKTKSTTYGLRNG